MRSPAYGLFSAPTAGLAFRRCMKFANSWRSTFTIGIGMNATLKKLSDPLLQQRSSNSRPPASRNGSSALSGIAPVPGPPNVGLLSNVK